MSLFKTLADVNTKVMSTWGGQSREPVQQKPESTKKPSALVKTLTTKQEIPVKESIASAIQGSHPIAAQVIKALPIKNPETTGGLFGSLIRAVPGSLARFTSRAALEFSPEGNKARQEGTSGPVIQPQGELSKALIGEEPITTLSSGPVARASKKALEKAGVKPETASTAGLFPSLALGLITENPFTSGASGPAKSVGKKIAKEVEEKIAKEAVQVAPKVIDNLSAVAKEAEDISKLPKIERELIKEFPEMGSADKLTELRSRTRSVISDQEALNTAKSLGMTKDTVLQIPVGTAMTKEQKLAVSGVVRNSLDELKTVESNLPAWKEAINGADENARVIAETAMSDYAKKKVETMKLLSIERGIAAESGRALQAHKVTAQAITDQEAILSKYLSNPKTPQEAKDYVYNQIEKFAGSPEEMAKMMQKLNQSTALQKFEEFATAIKLTAIPTHVTNMITSAARVLTDIPLRGISGALDSTIGKLYGGNKERFVKEMVAESQGQWAGFKTGWDKVVMALKDENFSTKSKQLADAQFKGPAIKGRLGKDEAYDRFLDFIGPKIRYPFRLLGVEDYILRRPAEMGAMYSEATRAALKSGLDPKSEKYAEFVGNYIHNPSLRALETAEKKADVSLFQAELGPTMKKIGQIRNQIPGAKLIVPFFNGIGNLIKQGIEFSPMAPILKGVRQDLGQRGPAMDALAKMSLGTAAMYPFVQHAIEGRITLGTPKDEKERARWQEEGKQPYSILIGDKWYPYGRFSPFADLITYSAVMGDALKNEDQKKFQDTLTDAFFGISTNVLDKTFVTGLSDLLKALSDPESGGAKKFVQNFLTGSTVPTIVSRGAQAIDPVQREANTIKEAYMSKIPGLSKELSPKMNRFGEEVTRPGTPAGRFFSPIVPSPVKANIIGDELESLGVDFGMPAQTAFGEKLTTEQYSVLKEVSGKTIYSVIDRLINKPEYQNLTIQEKKDALEKVISKVRTSVREAVAPDLSALAEIKSAIKKNKPDLTDEQIQTISEKVLQKAKESGIDLKQKTTD